VKSFIETPLSIVLSAMGRKPSIDEAYEMGRREGMREERARKDARLGEAIAEIKAQASNSQIAAVTLAWLHMRFP
jgi:hypothetical protein